MSNPENIRFVDRLNNLGAYLGVANVLATLRGVQEPLNTAEGIRKRVEILAHAGSLLAKTTETEWDDKLLADLEAALGDLAELSQVTDPINTTAGMEKRAAIVVRAARRFAVETSTQVDDEVLNACEALFNTPEVVAFVVMVYDRLPKLFEQWRAQAGGGTPTAKADPFSFTKLVDVADRALAA